MFSCSMIDFRAFVGEGLQQGSRQPSTRSGYFIVTVQAQGIVSKLLVAIIIAVIYIIPVCLSYTCCMCREERGK